MWLALLVALGALILIIVLVAIFGRRSSGSSSSTEDFSSTQAYHRLERENHGRRGEELVSYMLDSLIDAHDGFALNGFAFEDEQGFSSEIDHILICTAGVFVIETKANEGVVTGGKDDEYWHVRKREWQEDRNPKNPLKQNKGHINHLKRVWGKGAPKMYSIVIYPFANIDLVSDLVFDLSSAKVFIESKFENPVYSAETAKRLQEQLLALKARYSITSEEHIKRVKETYSA